VRFQDGDHGGEPPCQPHDNSGNNVGHIYVESAATTQNLRSVSSVVLVKAMPNRVCQQRRTGISESSSIH
jgi:hypothetical protein